MFNKKIKIYVARSMTGRDKATVVEEALKDKKFLEDCEIEVLCPVSAEQVKAEHKPLKSNKRHMDVYWRRDKEMIREAHVIIDATPHLKSEGVSHEIGYGRYYLWRKVIRIFPEGMMPPQSSIAFYEDDYITDDWRDAVMEIYRTHGTYFKRLKWRLDIFNRCLPKAFWHSFLEFLR